MDCHWLIYLFFLLSHTWKLFQVFQSPKYFIFCCNLLINFGANWDISSVKYTTISFQSLVKLEGWENCVTIISSDMRCWDAPEKADILVYSSITVLKLKFSFQSFICPVAGVNYIFLVYLFSRLVNC